MAFPQLCRPIGDTQKEVEQNVQRAVAEVVEVNVEVILPGRGIAANQLTDTLAKRVNLLGCQVFGLEGIAVKAEGRQHPDPTLKFFGRRFLFQIETPDLHKMFDGRIHIIRQGDKPGFHDLFEPLLAGKRNMVKQASAQKRIRQIFFRVAG